MPEMEFVLRWPDGGAQRCYSPSLVVTDHLEVGRAYPVADLVARVEVALTTASERVRARYGTACTAALAQLDDVRERAAALPAEHAGGEVVVEGFAP